MNKVKINDLNPMKEIFIATGNRGKLKEISNLLKKININSLGVNNFNIKEPEENGLTFEENSIIKAQYYACKTNKISLADDSGLSIPAIDNRPGIYSARWAQNKDFNIAFERIKKELTIKNINPFKEKISAYFICNLSLFNPNTNEVKSFEGRVDGYLSFPPKGDKGFGYDSIFIREGDNQTFAEIDLKVKDKISHRAIAFAKLQKFLQTIPISI